MLILYKIRTTGEWLNNNPRTSMNLGFVMWLDYTIMIPNSDITLTDIELWKLSTLKYDKNCKLIVKKRAPPV